MSARPPLPACPAPAELARAVSEGAGAALRAHLATCAACTADWRAQAEIAALGQALPFDRPGADRRQEVRAALLAAARAEKRWSPGWRRTAVLSVGVVAGAAAAAWLLLPLRPTSSATALSAPPAGAALAPGPAVPPPARRAAIIVPTEGARFQRLAGPPHEIVRLEKGTIQIDVLPATRGETFRVITADRVVEVRGTVFETTAAADGRLVAVRVRRGRVAVRAASPSPTAPAGEDLVVDAGREWTVPAGDPPAAAAAAAAITARDPAERAFTRGMDLLRGQDAAQAATAFERVVRLAPRGPLAEDAWYFRGVALAQSGITDEARAVLEQFLDRYPASPRAGEAAVMTGWLLLDAGEPEAAAARFRAGVDDRSARVRASARAGLEAVARPRDSRR